MRLRGILIKNHNNRIRTLESETFENKLIKKIKINGNNYIAVVDESNEKLTGISFPDSHEIKTEHLYGDIFVCKTYHDKYKSLSLKDINLINKNIVDSAYTASKKFPMSKKVLIFK